MADDQEGGHQSDPRNWLLPDDRRRRTARAAGRSTTGRRDDAVGSADHRVDPADRRRGRAAAALRPGRHRPAAALDRAAHRRGAEDLRRRAPSDDADDCGPALAGQAPVWRDDRAPRLGTVDEDVRPRLASAPGRRSAPSTSARRRSTRSSTTSEPAVLAAARSSSPTRRGSRPIRTRRPAPPACRPAPRARPATSAGVHRAARHDRPRPADGHRRRRRPRPSLFLLLAKLGASYAHGARRAGAGARRRSSSSTRSASRATSRPRSSASSPSPACRWPPTGGATAALPLVVRPGRRGHAASGSCCRGGVEQRPGCRTPPSRCSASSASACSARYAALILQLPATASETRRDRGRSARSPTTSAACSSARRPASTPLAAWISPNKTVEGLVGGMLAAILAVVLVHFAGMQPVGRRQLANAV